jgi:hypothetical protein
MKKLLLVVAAIFLFAGSRAQVTITPQLPQTGIKLKTQLWNLGLSNTGAAPVTVKISMVLTETSSGQQVLSATSNLLSLSRGVRLIQYNNVVPVNYTILNNTYHVDASPNGFLPVGNFTVCYEILKQLPGAESFENIAEECTQIEVEPLAPPYLSLPANQSEIEELRPVFSWIPPAPAAFFNNLSYNFKLVEVLNGQNPDDAVQVNIPLLMKPFQTGNNMQYPASLPALENGKTYAWQVAANNNGLFVAKTEVWTFKLKVSAPGTTPYPNETPYYRLKQEVSNAYFVCNGVLKLEYDNEINDREITISIYDVSSKIKKKMNLKQNSIGLKYGQNFIDIDMRETSGMLNGHYYLVELVNGKTETWGGKFEYKHNN